MVGPYAVLLRLVSDGTVSVCDVGQKQSDDESEISAILARAHILLVDRETLETPIKINLHNTDRGNIRLYQALFSDSDYCPWESTKNKY